MSNLVYHRTGITLRDAFIYQNADGTFNTGRVQADFTIRLSKDGVGNQATTGVTITEVDASNNPGEYAVAVATSGFVATSGAYVLVITRTAAPAFTYEQEYIVNITGSYTTTPPSFTATASNGRVMAGAVPISGATIYLTLGGVFYTQTTTDASGLWGPVYLSDGTFTVRAQASGYAQSTATITVSGASVTGPLADIALTVGSTVNPMSAAQLWAYARRMAVDITGSKADAIVKAAVNDALDMVSSARLWPHLLRTAMLPLRAPYSTGTITVSGTTITLSGGTWPTWAASGKVFVAGQIIDIATRTSATAVEVADTWGGAAITASTYLIYQNEYDLPDDMWRFHQNLPGQRWGWGASPVDPASVLNAEAAAVYGQSFPDCYAIANGNFMCWPYPSADAMLRYTYYARPARLAFDTDVADWDPVHLEMLKRAIDYQLARQVGKVISGDAQSTMAAYKESLGRDASQDKQPTDIPAVGGDMRVGLGHSLDWKRRT